MVDSKNVSIYFQVLKNAMKRVLIASNEKVILETIYSITSLTYEHINNNTLEADNVHTS